MDSIRSMAWTLLCFMCAVANAGINSWSARGPYGGIVTHAAIDPTNTTTVYAASLYALNKSTDGGVTWTTLTFNFGQYPIVDVQIDPASPTRLYVASLGGGIFRSTNGGSSFTRLSAVPTDANIDGPAAMAISTDGNSIYYSTLGNRFYRSTDGGSSFTQAPAMPASCQQLVVDPGNSAVIYAAFGPKLLKSTNGGTSWSELLLPATGVYARSILLIAGAPNTLWLSYGNNVWNTQNDGASWTLAKAFTETQVLQRDASSPAVLYASKAYGAGDVWKYASGTWQSLTAGVPAVINTLSVSPNNSMLMLAMTNSGVFRTINGGSTWSRSDDGINGENVRTLVAGLDGVFAGTDHGEIGVTHDDTLMQRLDVVSALTTTPDKMQIGSIATHPTGPNILIVGFNAAGYRYSTDAGVNWTAGTSLSTAWIDALAFDPVSPVRVYAAVRPSIGGPLAPVQLSTNGGLSFAAQSTNITGDITIQRLIVDPRRASRLFFASQSSLTIGNNGVFRSDDSGVTWANLRANSATFDLAMDPFNSNRIYAAGDGGLYISDNGGDTFTAAASLPRSTYGNPFAITVDPLVSNVVYAITATYAGSVSEYFVVRSVDGGASWERITNSTLPNWAPLKLAIDAANPTILWAATGGSGVHSFEIAPDLSIGITNHTGTRPLSVQSFFDVEVRNLGTLSATGLLISVTPPAGAQNVSATIPGGSCTPITGSSSLVCSLPFLKPAAIASARVNYTPLNAGALNVQSTVLARERDPAPSNNSTSATASATEVVDLVVTGSASPSTLDQGAAFSYAFQVRNAGPNASSVTRASITVDPGVTLGNVSPATCTTSGNTINCDFGNLASNGTASITVNGIARNTGTLRTTATVNHAATAVDSDATNDATTVDVTSRVPGSSSGGSSSSGGGGGGGSLSVPFVVILALLARARRRARVVCRSQTAGAVI